MQAWQAQAGFGALSKTETGLMTFLSYLRWCARRDSNPHALRHQNLNLARLPIPPRAHQLSKSLRGIRAGGAGFFVAPLSSVSSAGLVARAARKLRFCWPSSSPFRALPWLLESWRRRCCFQGDDCRFFSNTWCAQSTRAIARPCFPPGALPTGPRVTGFLSCLDFHRKARRASAGCVRLLCDEEFWSGRRDSNSRGLIADGFAIHCLQPLGHVHETISLAPLAGLEPATP